MFYPQLSVLFNRSCFLSCFLVLKAIHFVEKKRLLGHVPESELVMSFTSIMDFGLTLDMHKRVKYSTNRIIRTF